MNLKIILTIPLSHISHPNSLANPKSNHSQLPCGLQYCSSFSRVSPCPPQTLLTTAAMVALSYTRLVRPHHTSAQNPPTSFRIKASPYSVIDLNEGVSSPSWAGIGSCISALQRLFFLRSQARVEELHDWRTEVTGCLHIGPVFTLLPHHGGTDLLLHFRHPHVWEPDWELSSGKGPCVQMASLNLNYVWAVAKKPQGLTGPPDSEESSFPSVHLKTHFHPNKDI